jgi:hypothetical protein
METIEKIEKTAEFVYLESFPELKGKSRLDMLAEEIRKFLFEKIHPRKVRLYYIQVEGYVRLFELFDERGTLGLHGGQISSHSYLSKNKEIMTGINRTGIDVQADTLWEKMDPANSGHISVHFVYFEGPEREIPISYDSGPIYDGIEMTAYRFRFRLKRKPSSMTVVLSRLKITKEKWNRTKKEELV